MVDVCIGFNCFSIDAGVWRRLDEGFFLKLVWTYINHLLILPERRTVFSNKRSLGSMALLETVSNSRMCDDAIPCSHFNTNT